MERRTILAVVLTFLVLLGYQLYISKYYPPTEVSTKDIESQAGAISMTAAVPEKPAGIRDYAPEAIEAALPPKEIRVETERYIVTLSDVGGSIKNIVLKEYPDPRTKESFSLINVDAAEEGIFNMEGLGFEGLSKVRFTVLERGGEVEFQAKLKNGLLLTKRYIFPDSLYHIELELYLHNATDGELETEYSIVASSNIDIPTNLDKRYAQIVSEVSGAARRDSGRKGEGIFVEGVVKYAGLQNKYFSVIAKPNTAAKGVWLKQSQNGNPLSKIEIGKFVINPRTAVSHNFLLYAGPSKKEIMEAYDLKGAVSYGFFGGISEILLVGLRLFHRVFRNWGAAIILLSSFVNLMLFPLTRKSYESMKKMQELQPHMERLRNEHKDSPHKLNKEMMELYKKYNVNPMGGCLPLFLQIPVFIALYQALMRSLHLRGAEFLWIKDLSMPDAVRLPATLPVVGNSINILPILMSAAMLIQQKIATQKGAAQSAQAKQQQQMMILMPVLFLFIMYNFPSGLVLYWLTNTLLTMFEQRAIMRR